MNRAVVYLFTLILILTHHNSRAYGNNGDSTQKKKAREVAMSIASSLHTALQSYKNEQRSLCVSELTQKLAFELIKDVTHQVPKNCEVDSLVVGNDQLSRWGYFKSVDLQYVKDVEVVITMKTTQSKEIARTLADMFQNDGLALTIQRDNQYEFRDLQGGDIVDTRFSIPTQSHVSSRYHYQIEVLDDYLIVSVKEVMSDHWVKGDQSADKTVDAFNPVTKVPQNQP